MNDERITNRPAPAPANPDHRPYWLSAEDVYLLIVGMVGGGIVGLNVSWQFGLLPCLVVTLLGATVGGLIVCWVILSWRPRGMRVRDEALPAALPWSEAITTAPIHKPRFDRVGGHPCAVTGLTFSPDGGHLASCDDEGAVHVHDLQSGVRLWAAKDFAKAAVDLAYSRDGRLLAVSGDEAYIKDRYASRTSVRIYDALDGRELRRIDFCHSIGPILFLPDRRLLIGLSDRLRLWELETPSEQRVVPSSVFSYFQPYDVIALTFRDGIALVGCSFSENACLLSLESGEQILTFEGHKQYFTFGRARAVVALAVSPSGDHVLSGGHDGYARIWALRSGEELRRFDGHYGGWGWHGVTGIGWLSEDEAVSTGDDGMLRVWDTRTGQELARHNHGPCIRRLAVLGRTAATGASDGSIRLWALT